MAKSDKKMSKIDLQKTEHRIHIDRQMSRSFQLQPNAVYPQPTLIACGYQKCRKTYHVRRTNFRPFGLEFVLRGKGHLSAQHKSYALTQGMVFSYGGNEPHIYHADPDDPMEKIHIIFVGKSSQDVLLNALGQITTAVRLSNPDEVSEIFENILKESEALRKNYQEICNHYLQLLLLKIEALKISNPRGAQASAGTFQACKAYMDTHFIGIGTAQDIAKQNNISLSYLCRIFKRYAGRSPHAYLLQLKMNRAAHLLVTTAQSVKEIAYELKFKDPYNFSRAFKKQFGRSPQHYRKLNF